MKNIKIRSKSGQQITVAQDLYVYQAKLININPNQTQTTTIDIEADSSFTWLKTTYLVTGNTQTTKENRIIPALTVQINDTGSGRSLQQVPVQIDLMAGSGELPFILPKPRTFAPKSTIQVTFINTSTNDQYVDVSLCLHGYKQWKLG